MKMLAKTLVLALVILSTNASFADDKGVGQVGSATTQDTIDAERIKCFNKLMKTAEKVRKQALEEAVAATETEKAAKSVLENLDKNLGRSINAFCAMTAVAKVYKNQ